MRTFTTEFVEMLLPSPFSNLELDERIVVSQGLLY